MDERVATVAAPMTAHRLAAHGQPAVELVDRLKLTNQDHPLAEIASHLSSLIAQAKLDSTD